VFSNELSAGTPPRFPAWQREYEAVLSETDTRALFKRVEIAEAAILTRRDALEGSSDHHSERQAMEDALKNLREIKRDRLKFL
jgi:hypothetical protein